MESRRQLQAPIEIAFPEWNENLYRMLTMVMGRHPKLSRANLADELSRRTGLKITAGMLYGWTSREGVHGRYPLSLSRELCLVLDDFELFAFILGEHAQTVAQLVAAGKGTPPGYRKRK